jgi:DNA-binding MarR family transcriptional regulator
MQASTATAQASPIEDLTRHLGGFMKYLMTSTGRDFFAELERRDMGLSQVKTLQVLTEAEEAVPITAISDSLGLSLPTVSRSVEALVTRELASRTEDPRDRRSKLVRITAKGRRTADQLYALRAAGLREWVESLTQEERESLAEGLRPLVRREDVAAHLPRR